LDWLNKQLQEQHMNVETPLNIGWIPVMVLFEDDFATNIPQLNNKTSSKGMNGMNQCQGGLKFLNLSEEVIELDNVVRQSEDQLFFKTILE
jgi:hypothetical protein